MKFKHKEKIAFNIAKDWWENTDDTRLKYYVLKRYIDYLRAINFDDYGISHAEYEKLCELNWKDLALYNCDAPSSELRKSVSYYLGIGLYENCETKDLRPIDIQYQRQYKLKIISKSERVN